MKGRHRLAQWRQVRLQAPSSRLERNTARGWLACSENCVKHSMILSKISSGRSTTFTRGLRSKIDDFCCLRRKQDNPARVSSITAARRGCRRGVFQTMVAQRLAPKDKRLQALSLLEHSKIYSHVTFRLCDRQLRCRSVCNHRVVDDMQSWREISSGNYGTPLGHTTYTLLLVNCWHSDK